MPSPAPTAPVTLDEEPLRSLDRLPTRLSPSRAKDFEQCPRLFFYKTIAHLESPPTVATAKGTLAHVAFERLFDHPRPDRNPATALAYVEPAWRSLVDPLVERGTVAPDSPEFRIREAGGLWRESVESGSVDEDRRLRQARAYRELAPAGSEAEAGLLAQARAAVENYFTIERPWNFDPEARELHLQAEAAGVTLHGFIDRLDRYTTSAGEERWVITDYKGLALDTPLPTPDGWTTMGEVCEGDEIIGANGHPVRVTHKSLVHDRDCFEITFSDGAKIISDDVHTWWVRRHSTLAPEKMSMRDLYEAFVNRSATGKYPDQFSIPNGAPLAGTERELPLDPWVLGVWLGDGSSHQGGITIGHNDVDDMLTILKERWGAVSLQPHSRSTSAAIVTLLKPYPGLCGRGHVLSSTRRGCSECRRSAPLHGCRDSSGRKTCSAGASLCPSRRLASDTPLWNIPARTVLRKMNLLGNKHVPREYLRAPRSQRLDLLRGLMDSDGHWHPRRQQAIFVNTNEALADAVAELVSSLGVNASRYAVRPKNPRHSVSYRVSFTPIGFNPFLLPRKAHPCADAMAVTSRAKKNRALNRRITDIQPTQRVPTQCLTVDAPDSLFLCGRTMIPTHNTGRVPQERFLDDAFFGLKVYAVLFAATHHAVPYSLRLVYVTAASDAVKVLPVTPDLLEATQRRLGALWRAIRRSAEREEWTPRRSPLCNWCAFQSICPAWNPELSGLVAGAEPATRQS